MAREKVTSIRQRRHAEYVEKRAIAKPTTPRYNAVELAELTSKARKQLPTSVFAIPSKRAYPIHDEAHARNALSRVAQFGTPAEKAQVRAAVARRYPNMGKSKVAKRANKAMQSVRGGK